MVILRLGKLTTSLAAGIIVNIFAVLFACSKPNNDSILMTKFIEYNFFLNVSPSVRNHAENDVFVSFSKTNNKAFFHGQYHSFNLIFVHFSKR